MRLERMSGLRSRFFKDDRRKVRMASVLHRSFTGFVATAFWSVRNSRHEWLRSSLSPLIGSRGKSEIDDTNLPDGLIGMRQQRIPKQFGVDSEV
jgi:hypothetical protein